MAAPYIVPFNHQPSETGDHPSTFTCGAGRYARVTITATVNFTPGVTLSGGPSSVSVSVTPVVTTQYYWLKAGDTISIVESSGSNGTTSISANEGKAVTALSTINFLLNGNAVFALEASGSVAAGCGAGAGGTISINRGVNFKLAYEQYKTIT